MTCFPLELIDSVRAGSLEALVELDRRGIFAGEAESFENLAERLNVLEKNLAELNQGLEAGGGEMRFEGLRLRSAARIPATFFAHACEVTSRTFDFAIDWAPGFFLNPRFSWLFGGCAFMGYPDFFALFIVRASFAKNERWLMYRREELLAHELSHLARVSLESSVFEETAAYQTAPNRFRRKSNSAKFQPQR